MNGQVFPLFEHTHILRTPMLTELRDYAYEYGQLDYEGYSDGIINGCRITTTEDSIALNRGIIRHAGRLYLITQPILLEYQPTDYWTMLKLQFKDEIRRDGYIYRELGTVFTDNLELRGDEMELCRFKLKTGARLRIKYVDFADRNTEFDTVNTIYTPFAAMGKSSLSPDITRAFALEAAACRAEPADTAFCLMALNAARALERDAIILYIAEKLKKEFKDYANQELFEFLRIILNQLKGNGARDISEVKRARRQIIVD